jgi:hypothetical protein
MTSGGGGYSPWYKIGLYWYSHYRKSGNFGVGILQFWFLIWILDAVSRWTCGVNLQQYARGDLQSIGRRRTTGNSLNDFITM